MEASVLLVCLIIKTAVKYYNYRIFIAFPIMGTFRNIVQDGLT